MDFVWALIFLIGYEVLSLPLRGALTGLGGDPGTRRVLSRIAGPAVFCMAVWFAGRVLPVALSGWFFWVVLFAPCMGYAVSWAKRSKQSFLSLLGYEPGEGWFGSIGLELISVILFFGFVVLRRYSPDMTAYPINSSAAEKFTNAMLFWANWHATALPPEDYWLAGQPLVYYYWGHFFWAWLGRMISAPPELAINLAQARLALLIFEAAWLLGRSVGLTAGWAIAAGLVAGWGGNIAAIPPAVKVIRESWPAIAWGGYSYWDARSVMPYTVNEFPAFTAILGDFHSHQMALPWLIGWVAVLIAGKSWVGEGKLKLELPTGIPLMVGWVAIGVGSVLSNMWNLPLMAWAVFLALVVVSGRGFRALGNAILLLIPFGIVLAAGMALMRGGQALPLPEEGSGLLGRLPLKLLQSELRTPVSQLMFVWGLPVIAIGLAALARVLTLKHWGVLVFMLSLLALLCSLLSGPMLWVAVALWAGILAWPGSAFSGKPAWLMAGVLAVLIGLELVFVNDYFVGNFERYNTYFKFSYPLWPPLIVVGTAAARELWNAPLRPVRWIGRVCIVCIAVAASVYPIFAWPARTIQARAGDARPMPRMLNAFDFLQYQRAPYYIEAPLLDWIRRKVPAGVRVAEAGSQEPYKYAGRVASLAGRPVPLGWAHHEVQWRGPAAQAMIQQKSVWIDQLYKGRSPEEIRTAARELGTRYVMVGVEEVRRYGPETLNRVGAIGSVEIRADEYGVVDLGESVVGGRE